MKILLRIVGFTVVILALEACSSTIFKTFDIEGKSLSVDAKQRIIVSTEKGARNNETRNIVCAEPSPDALVAMAQAAGAQANIIGQGSGSLEFSMNESVASIALRTATIQLLRDNMYRACEAYLNGAINEFGYALILTSIDDVMIKLLGIEGLTNIPVARQAAVGTTASTTTQQSQSVTPGEGGAQGTTAGSSGASGAGAGGSSGEGSATTSAGSTTPQISQPSSRTTVSDRVAEAIQAMTRTGPPGTSIVGACLMWLSVTVLDKDSQQYTKMIDYCDKAFKWIGDAVSASATGNDAVGRFCKDYLKNRDPAKIDKDTVIACVDALAGS